MRDVRHWSHTQDFLDREAAAVCARNRERLGGDLDAFDESLSRLLEILEAAFDQGRQEGWQGRPLGIAALCNWSLGRLVSARGLLLEGYLSDAVILARAAFEALWLLIDLDIDAAHASDEDVTRLDRWMRGEQFVATGDTIRRRGDHNERLAERWKALSDLSHPGKFGAVVLQFDTSDPGGAPSYRFGLAGTDRPVVPDLILHIMWEQLLALIGYMPMAFPQAIGDSNAFGTWRAQMQDRVRRFEEYRVLPAWRALFGSQPARRT